MIFLLELICFISPCMPNLVWLYLFLLLLFPRLEGPSEANEPNMSTLSSPQMEHAMLLVNTYVPETVLENWRLFGITSIMAGLCLCPIVAWVWESAQNRPEPAQDAS